MGALRFKVLYDLWINKARTLQVVLIIGIGAAAIGMILGTRNLVVPGMQNMWQSIDPAMILLYTGPSVSQDQLNSLKRVRGVADLDAYSTTTIEWRLSPDQDWKPAGLTARMDYEHQKLNKLELVQGNWPSDETIGFENGSDTFFGIQLGAPIYLRIDGREFKLPSDGILYNQISQPAYLGGTAQFYVTQDKLEYLTGTRDYNRILISAASYDEEQVKVLGSEIQDKLEKQGIGTFRAIQDPNKHFFQDQMDGVFTLLGILSALALVLGLLLVYNTINALISQQVDQIGIMKAVGARTWQIVRLYLTIVLIYGLLALMVALPIGIFGARAISSWLIGSFGATIGNFEIDQTSVIVMVVVVLLAPLLASLVPIFSGARTTVRDAISTYGLSTEAGLLERLLAKMHNVSRLVLVTISNAFRHKGRVVLLQISLVMSGLMFMMVISVRDSVSYTIRDVLFSILSADVTYVLDRNYRIEEVEQITNAYPGIQSVEMWVLANATARPRGQPETDDDESVVIFGVPLPTQLYGYQLRAGRWLLPEDTSAVVLNQHLAENLGVGIGDWITIRYSDRRQSNWQVVGLIFDPVLTNSAHISLPMVQSDLGLIGKASTIWVQTQTTDPAAQIELAKNLRNYYEDNHIKVSPQRGVFGIGGDATVETGNAFIGQFEFLVILLGLMAVIIGIVGSIALSGALSLSVIERRREIGVMRAIGASSWTIFRMFIGEGVLLGWLSWLIALPLSLPAGRLMVQALGAAFNLDIVYKFTPVGPLLWLGIITLLSYTRQRTSSTRCDPHQRA